MKLDGSCLENTHADFANCIIKRYYYLPGELLKINVCLAQNNIDYCPVSGLDFENQDNIYCISPNPGYVLVDEDLSDKTLYLTYAQDIGKLAKGPNG